MTQRTLPGMDRSEGKRLKQEGIEQALNNEYPMWKYEVLEVIRHVAFFHERFTADDVMVAVEAKGIGKPHHPNVWGGIYRLAMNEGVMEKSGDYVKSRRPGQHATDIPVYTSLIHGR